MFLFADPDQKKFQPHEKGEIVEFPTDCCYSVLLTGKSVTLKLYRTSTLHPQDKCTAFIS